MGTTAEKLTYLNTTKGKIKDSINLTGANITTEPFRQYSTKLNSALLDIINNGTQEVWNNWEKVSASNVSSASLNQTVEAPMKLDLKGNTYQEENPTPDNPKDIHIVSGNNSIKVEGKNLFDKNNSTFDEYLLKTGETAVDIVWVITPYIKVDSGANYTYQGITRTGNSPYSCYYDSSKQFVSSFKQATGTNTITIPSGVNYVRFSIMNKGAKHDINTFMIEKGSSASTYTPYVSQTYPINLGSIELCKIGDYQDRIFKAIEGDSFYDTLDSATKQTLDTESWYKYGAIGKVVLNGSETWNIHPTLKGFYPNTNLISNVVLPSDNTSIPLLYSNYFTPNTYADVWDNNIDFGIALAPNGTNNPRIRNNNITTTSDFQTWLSTHNTTIYYALDSPTYTQITDNTLIGQLEAIKKSYNEQTNISQTPNDLPFILDITALKEI